MATNKLNKLFVLVSGDSNIAQYKAVHVGDDKINDDYYSKIAFLRDTGEIVTAGKVFAINKDSDLTALKDVIGYNNNAYKSLSTTAQDVISAINEILASVNEIKTDLGSDDTSGVRKRVKDLEDSVDTTTTGLKDRMTSVEGKLSTLTTGTGSESGDTSKSVRAIASEEVAKIVANADAKYDTLKEIADWILSDSTGAANMGNRISALESNLGNASDGTNDATGLHANVESLESEITTLKANDSTTGSIANKIKTAVESLDAEKTSADMASPSADNDVTKTTYISVANKVTVTEVDGKLTSVTVTGGSADAAGAANKAYNDLLGDSNDSDSTMTLYGVKAYAGSLVSNKNVTASGDNSLINASATNNAVSVSATQDLIDAVSHANTAIQSLSGSPATYISAAKTSGTTQGTIELTIGSLSVNSSNNSDILTYTEGLVSAKIVADAINSIDLWENYVSSNS